jgi:hypothetical protein
VKDLPPCGLYRTLRAIGSVEAGRLVYFHNHGDPGPGLYLPESWSHNRARFSANGMTAPADFDPAALHALRPEGFYRVTSTFYCCDKRCTSFEADSLVQLGYNGAAAALVFMPQIGGRGMHLPTRGSVVDEKQLKNLSALKVAADNSEQAMDLSLPRGMIVH